ncbi:MAG: DNA polymerase III subunit gamma/tau [Dehalococcoidales bacterium]|nr:DNA polymerase III subunit gamma/tau [Dehalococcoidales bacterium]
MASQVFYRKWRPQTLSEVVGQESVTQTLRNALTGGRISHAYLFCGPRGTGKTSTARILAKAVNCLTTDGKGEPCNTCEMCRAITEGSAIDVIEIDAASNTSVDDIRSLREKVNYAPAQARYKVYIIDEFHMLSGSASNALLKTLEEPPPHVIFILATTEVHKILPTIMSRCQRFDFRRLSQTDIMNRLAYTCQTENITITPESLKLIARSATGSMRDAWNLLEQLTLYYGSDISFQQVQDLLGITGDSRVREIAKYIVDDNVSKAVATINSVNNDGLDLRNFKRELVEYLRCLLLMKTGSEDSVDMSGEDLAELKQLASCASLPKILRALKLFSQVETGAENNSTLSMELAIVDSITKAEDEMPKPAKQPEHKVESVSRPVQAKAPAHIPQQAKQVEPKKTEPKAETKTAAPPETKKAETAKNQSPAEITETGDKLKLDWRGIIEQAPADTKRSPALAILRSAGVKPVAFENNVVTLSFRYPYIKEQLEKMENQRVVEKIISSFVGHPCRVQCVLENNNGLIKEALKLGAQIVDVEEA